MVESVGPKRLAKVAVEFNVKRDTVVDFLNSEGIAVENNPNAKVTEEAYIALLKKFSPHKLTKEKSDKLKLTPNIHKEEKNAEAIRIQAEVARHPKVEIAVAETHTSEPEAIVKEPEPMAKEPEIKVKEHVIEEKPSKVSKNEGPVISEPEKEAETQQLKVVGKIDL